MSTYKATPGSASRRSRAHRIRVLGSALAAALLATTALTAVPAVAGAQVAHPFQPGERMTYDVRFSAMKVGTGSMEVRGITEVRGRPAYHTVFRVRGGTLFYRVDDVFESWFATDDLSALRFHKDQDEGPKERQVKYEIYPERQAYNETTKNKGEQPSVQQPLDEGSFLYLVRTVPLEPGQTYHFNRYFKPDRNPVTIRVLRRERIKVPAGTFDAIVVQPVIKSKGIFSEGGHAEVWLSDDENRMLLQIKSRLSIGSLNLYLKSYYLPNAVVAGSDKATVEQPVGSGY